LGVKGLRQILSGAAFDQILNRASTPQFVRLPFNELENTVRIITNEPPFTPLGLHDIRQGLETVAGMIGNTPGNEPTPQACRDSSNVLREFAQCCYETNSKDGKLEIPEPLYRTLLKTEPLFSNAAAIYQTAEREFWRSPKKIFEKTADTTIYNSPYGYCAAILPVFAQRFASLVEAVGIDRPNPRISPVKNFYREHGFIIG